MTILLEYNPQFTLCKIKKGGKSVKPTIKGTINCIFNITNSVLGISIDTESGVIKVDKNLKPGNYVLEIEAVDVNTKLSAKTRHVVFMRDPNQVFPGDEEISDEDDCSTCVDNKKDKKPITHLDKRQVIKSVNKRNIGKSLINNKKLKTKSSFNIKNYFSKNIIKEKNISYYLSILIFGILITFFRDGNI